MSLKRTDIRVAWPQVKDQIAKIMGDNDRPEELYAACVYGKADLFMAEDGFVVLRLIEQPHTGEKECMVWIGFGEGINMINRYEKEIREIAKQTGCVSMTFRTDRPGIERLLPSGWVMRHIEFTARI